MKQLILLVLVLITAMSAQSINSPDNKLSLTFEISDEGEALYSLTFNKIEVIKKSKLGLELKDIPSFTKDFYIIKTDKSTFDETWKPVWGEVKEIRNNYNELKVTLAQKNIPDRTLIITFRLFNDGLGFRYEFPASKNLHYFTVKEEITEFNLTSDHKAFWIPGDYDSQEYKYTLSRLSEVDALKGNNVNEISTKSIFAKNGVQTPLMLKTDNGLYINIHEAALVNYPAMHLLIDQSKSALTSHLVPDVLGNKAYLQAPAKTPWRTIIVADNAPDILMSKLILNLNEPSVVEDESWIYPQKYIGIWWEMHVGTGSWNYSDTNNVKLEGTDWSKLIPNGRHAANTKRTKEYIDFAAEHDFKGVLVEGWNVGWEDWFGNWKEEVFDFVTPYPDFNLAELSAYAKSKNVKLIMHHETSASASNYERRMDEAYRFMNKYGYDAVKTGYVGRIIPRGEHHDGQMMVNHFVHTAKTTAKYKIMINAHESVRPTGLHRTYPNWVANEAARGNEFNAWSSGNLPEHETILPFTRLMGGPMDYTPGIFQIKLDYFIPGKKEQVHTTLVKQLALYVTMYSPLQMAADYPESYQRFPDAFQFIKDVDVDWDDTKVLQAEPGDYIITARKSKGKNEWFLGAITDENKRDFSVSLNFLDDDVTYLATIYADADNAHWEKNPMAYQIKSYLVNADTILKLKLVESGGTAISFKAATKEDISKYKKY
ncbi:MAG: glycoside hydrolase family 97 protein [Ignavibacteria bacterium]|nr:glycoside hydrolase family 97 protein [Ignavibacteria bacterium]